MKKKERNFYMNLEALAKLTGQKSVSEMTMQELHEHLRIIRVERLRSKPVAERAARVPKEPSERKPRAASKPKLPFIDSLSLAEVEKLLVALGG